MKIVHLCLCGPYNDNWGYQDNIIPKYNKKDGHDVTVITSILINSRKHEGYEKISPGEYYLDDGVKVVRIPFKKFFIDKISERLRIYEGLSKKLQEEKPDVIFVHGVQFWDIRTVIKYKKKNPNVKIFADNHADYINSARNFISRYVLHKIIWRSGIKKFIPCCVKIFAITPSCKKFAREMYDIPDEKMEYLYLGADVEKIDFINREKVRSEIRKKLDIKEDDFVLITGGKLSKEKNIELLIDALKSIDSPRVKLIIFGAFTADIEQELLKKIRNDNRIKYIGWLKGEDVYNYYFASDVAIFPGTKSALWEQAIASGLPIICRRWEGMEYIDVGGNCIFLKGDNKDKIIESVILLMNDKEMYNSMKQVAMTKGYETFSYKTIARKAIGMN